MGRQTKDWSKVVRCGQEVKRIRKYQNDLNPPNCLQPALATLEGVHLCREHLARLLLKRVENGQLGLVTKNGTRVPLEFLKEAPDDDV